MPWNPNIVLRLQGSVYLLTAVVLFSGITFQPALTGIVFDVLLCPKEIYVRDNSQIIYSLIQICSSLIPCHSSSSLLSDNAIIIFFLTQNTEFPPVSRPLHTLYTQPGKLTLLFPSISPEKYLQSTPGPQLKVPFSTKLMFSVLFFLSISWNVCAHAHTHTSV